MVICRPRGKELGGELVHRSVLICPTILQTWTNRALHSRVPVLLQGFLGHRFADLVPLRYLFPGHPRTGLQNSLDTDLVLFRCHRHKYFLYGFSQVFLRERSCLHLASIFGSSPSSIGCPILAHSSTLALVKLGYSASISCIFFSRASPVSGCLISIISCDKHTALRFQYLGLSKGSAYQFFSTSFQKFSTVSLLA